MSNDEQMVDSLERISGQTARHVRAVIDSFELT